MWGPTRAAARLESSKKFAKEVMDRGGRRHRGLEGICRRGSGAGTISIQLKAPFVVKADGLAAGKGVLVTADRESAAEWVRRCLGGGFGPAGTTVVIEEFLDGPEVSVFALCSGTDVIALQPARDYKRLLTGDEGPNTGGMGAFSPISDLPEELVAETIDQVIKPVLATMASAGNPYTGFLYVGLVLTTDGPRVLGIQLPPG